MLQSFSKLKLVTDNLLLYAAGNWEATENLYLALFSNFSHYIDRLYKNYRLHDQAHVIFIIVVVIIIIVLLLLLLLLLLLFCFVP